MSKKINKKLKSKGLWARLAALMLVLLMTTTQNTLMGQDQISCGNDLVSWAHNVDKTHRTATLQANITDLSSDITVVTVNGNPKYKELNLNGKYIKKSDNANNVSINFSVEFVFSGSGSISGTTVKVTKKAKVTTDDNLTIGNGGVLNMDDGTIAGDIKVQDGVEIVKSGGSITGAITVESPGCQLTMNETGGTISNGIIVKSNKLTIKGSGKIASNITIKSGGTLEIENGYSGNITGGITIESGGTLTVSGGTITGTITNNGTLEVSGGTISSVTNNGTLTMSGGTLTVNGGTTSKNVTVSGGSFAMSGGTITGVKSDYGGLYVTGGTVTLSGTAKITGNTKADGTTKCNLNLASGKTVTVNTLGSEASIGVTTADEPTASTSVQISTETSTDYHEKFIPDDKSYETAYENNYIVLKKKSEYVAIIVDKDGTQIGDPYTSVKEAIGKVSPNQIVKMINDSQEKENISISKTVTLNLNGNTLTGTGTGAVITIGTGGNLTLEATNGGTITCGSTGVHVSAGTFNMNGGTITGNTNYGVNFENGTMSISGTAKIKDNTNADGTPRNLYLASGKTVTVNNLQSEDASIGVTTAEKPSGSTSVRISTNKADGYKDKFFPDDDESYDVDYDNNNYVVLKQSEDVAIIVDGNDNQIGSPYTSVKAAIESNYSTGNIVRMINDSQEKENISISKTVTLNLNGNTLTGTGTGAVITIGTGGNLTLDDGVGSGKIKGSSSNSSKGVEINLSSNSSASFTMESGIITGFSTGVNVCTNKKNAKASFTMNGGIINYCFTGVSVNCSSGDLTFTMTGGKITGNTTCGVDFQSGTVKLGGTAKISGNPDPETGTGTPCNLRIASGKTVAIYEENRLTNGAEILVTLVGGSYPCDFATGASESDVNYFGSDNADYYDYYYTATPYNKLALKAVGSDVTGLGGDLDPGEYNGTYNINGVSRITGEKKVKINGTIHNNTSDNLIIEDGCQLITKKDLKATVKKSTNNNGNSGKYTINKWYLICSPVQNQLINEVIGLPSDENYDLYRLSADGKWWENYENSAHSGDGGFYYGNNCKFESGRVYLYASEKGKELKFKGTVNTPDFSDKQLGEKNDVFVRNLEEGLNLVGNPFTQKILVYGAEITGIYRLNGSEDWVEVTDYKQDDPFILEPMEGVLVESKSVCNLTIEAVSEQTSQSDSDPISNIEISVANAQYDDRACAVFGSEARLTKIEHMNSEIPMLYIPQDGDDYAIVSMSESTKEFPVGFEAKTTGKYVLSMNSNRSYTYLHLIDHETNAEIDMLANEEYEFIGSPADSRDRFTVRFELSGEEANEQHFAYQVGSELVVSGEGTLQVMDVLGRVVLSEEVNGSTRVSVSGLRTGAYIVRMIGNEIKTQKVVIK